MEEKKRDTVIMEKFRKARTVRQQKDPLWQELDAFDRNEQWALKDSAPWIPKPVTNFIHLVKYTKRAALSTENPTGKLRAVTPNGIELVDALNKAYEDTFQRIKARKVVRECIETSKLLGTGIAHVYWNEQQEGRLGSTVKGDEGFMYEGEIETRQIDPASFFPDPSAFRIEDCGFIIVRERRSKEWAKQRFGKDVLKNEDGEVSSPDERGEIYLGRDYDSEQKDGKVDFLSYYEKKGNEDGGYTYTREYLIDGKLVGKKEKLRPNRYPFAILYDFPQRQDFWAMSTCQFILDNQKIINKVESVMAMIGVLMQNPQKIVTRNSGIDPQKMQKYGNVPAMTWVSNDPDPSRSVHYITPPQIPMALFNLLENAKANIREVTGITEAYSGQNVGSLQTSSGVQALIDRATMRDRDQMYDVEMFVEDYSKLIIDFMTEYYEEERQVRIIGDNPEDYSFVSFRGTDYKNLDYDMFVDVSAKAPITRMRETQEAKELLNMQGQYGQSFPAPLIKGQEAIRMMNITHGERIIKRMDHDEMQNEAQKITDVLNMYTEALMQGTEPQEAQQMAISMLEQKYGQQQAGSTGQGPSGPTPTDPNVPMA
jgi:hypothetical protein